MAKIILAHSELTNTIYALIGKEKIDITEQAIAEVKAIKALEHCDAISREPFMDSTICEGISCNECAFNRKDKGGCILEERVMKLPSVTPQPKMGWWKAFTHSAYRGNDEDGEPIWREVTVYHCKLCNRRTVIKENYCPNCGAKMVEPQEGGD